MYTYIHIYIYIYIYTSAAQFAANGIRSNQEVAKPLERGCVELLQMRFDPILKELGIQRVYNIDNIENRAAAGRGVAAVTAP